MGTLENECQIPQNNILHIYFLGLPWEIVFGVIEITNYIYSPWKM